METSLLESLLDRITGLIQLSSSGTVKCELVQQYCHRVEDVLKLLKPIIDSLIDVEADLDEELQKAFVQYTQLVEESIEMFESWKPLMSKVYFVLQVDLLAKKMCADGMEILELLKASDQFLPSELGAESLEYRVQKIKHMGLGEISMIISKAINDQLNGGSSSDILDVVADSLRLKSNQELLIEAVALEKLKECAEQAEKTGEADYIDQIISLISHMHDILVRMKQSELCNRVEVPAGFRCPLSLEIMTDPVIVESGQTYERAFIQNWMGLGLTVCPKTRQTLAHTTLIPNFTVKTLITDWCKFNNVKLPGITDSVFSTPFDSNMPQGAVECDEVASHAASNGYADPKPTANLIDPQEESNFPSRLEAYCERRNTCRPSRIVTSPTLESRAELLEIKNLVKKHMEDLRSGTVDAQINATAEIRLLAKHNMENRIVIADCGSISLLVELLRSTELTIQENAVTALLNLSIDNNNNKSAIANAGAIEPLIHVLQTGSSEAKENAAGTLLSLSVIDDNKKKIGESGAIQPLVDLLANGSPIGKKDAVTALYNLSIFPKNKGRIVQAGAVKYLLELMNPAYGMIGKVVAVLSNLTIIHEGRTAIGEEGGIPVLVDVLELGSGKSKENAAAALLQLCTNSNRYCEMVLQEGAVPPLVALSQFGTPRAKEKARLLLSFFRN